VETKIAPPGGAGGSPSASGLAPGQRVLDRYCLRERLGSGGFGEVWRAYDELLKREVAIKRILGGDNGPRAAREAKAAARLSDPAIVALYEAVYEDGVCHLISELVDGSTLADLIAEDVLGDEEILEIGLALCDALAHAHTRGVIHRDVKPHNVLVPGDRSARGPAAKLTDFGGALLDGEQALTRTGDVLGTLAYMAPEQSEGREAGPPADLYALALVLYEALTGQNPVRAATPAATVRRIGSRLPPLRRQRRDLRRPLAAAIDRALLPAERQRGAIDDLAAALAAALTDDPDESPDARSGDGEDELGGEDETDLIDGAELDTALLDAGGPDAGRLDVEPTIVASRLARRPRIAAPAQPVEQPIAVAPAPAPGVPAGAAAQRLDAPADARGWFALPRLLWLLAAIVLAVVEVLAGRPGLALILFAAALPLLVAMPRRAGPIWLLGAVAPLLGLAGLAAAAPSIVGQPRSPRLRASLGGLAYWWLSLAELALGRRMPPGAGFVRSAAAAAERHVSLGLPALRAPSRWEGSVTGAVHALGGLLSVPVLAAVTLWALGALCLPLLVRGRSLWPDLARATIWSAALLLGPALLDGWLRAGGRVDVSAAIGSGAPIAGAALGALLALALAAARFRPKAEGPSH
jgi:hypothetical protein